MRIAHLRATPRTVSHSGLISLYVQVEGIRLSYQDMGKRPVSGEGHVQYYLDRIPRDAWSKVDLGHGYLGAAGTPTVTLGLAHSPARVSRGKHRIVAALAKNNRILYHAPASSVAITVR